MRGVPIGCTGVPLGAQGFLDANFLVSAMQNARVLLEYKLNQGYS